MKHGSILLLGLVLMASCSKDADVYLSDYGLADIPVEQYWMGIFEGEWFYGDYAPAKGAIKVDRNDIQMDFPCEMVFGNILDGMRRNYLLHPEEEKINADSIGNIFTASTYSYSDPEQTIAYRMSGASSEAIYASATLVENHFTNVKSQLDFSFGVIADGHKYQIDLINSKNEINAVFDLMTKLWTLVYRFRTIRVIDLDNGRTFERLISGWKQDQDSQSIIFKAKERKDLSGTKSFR